MKAFDCVDQKKTVEIFKEMGIPDDLSCLLRNLCAGLRNNSSNWTWNNRLVPNWEGVQQGYILLPCLFNLYAKYIMRMMREMNQKLESRLPGELSIASDMQIIPRLWQKAKRN